MNEKELQAGLRAIRQERTTCSDEVEVHREVLAIPIEQIPQERNRSSLFSSWRERSMFSALRFAAAAVVVALFGGFVLAGILATQQGDKALPAAVVESPSLRPDPVRVTITARWTWYTDLGTVVQPGATYGVIDGATGSMTWEATDPRLSGAATYIGRHHVYPKLYGDGLQVGAWTVTNEDGTWHGDGRGICTSSRGWDTAIWYGCHDQVVLSGKGAYEGLTAYLTWNDAHEEDTIRGLILAEDWPPLPEPAT